MASAAASPNVVTPEWLEENLDNPDVKVLDSSWFLPTMGTCHSYNGCTELSRAYNCATSLCPIGSEIKHNRHSQRFRTLRG